MATPIMPETVSYASAINAALVAQKGDVSSLAQTGEQTSVLSMSSKEIASITGKEHSNVIRDIKSLASQLYEIDPSNLKDHKIQGVAFEWDNRGYVSEVRLDKDHTLTLLTGYDAKARLKVIRRWQELELQVRGMTRNTAALPTPEQEAVSSMQAWSQLGDIFGCPKHIALQEGVKTVHKRYGLDLTPLLQFSSHNDNIPEEDVMLEPSDIGERLGFVKGNPAGTAINRLLEKLGWQTKVGKDWVATDMGRPHCIPHAWKSRGKEGYNLKWRLKDVESLLSVPRN